MNGIEPFAYLKATLEAIAGGHPASKVEGLLPRGIQHTAKLTRHGASAPLTIRMADPEGEMRSDGRPDRRRQPPAGVEAAQHECGEDANRANAQSG